MDTPLISVIIPVYNLENYICDTLDSVCQQTYKNLEIIVINDGSTDKTKEIIDSYCRKDSRIIAIHKENTGVSDTRNKGIDIAKGDYIGFVDGDDTIDKDFFEFLLNNATCHNADISHCGYKIICDGKPDVNMHGTKVKILQNNYDGIKDLLSGKIVEPGIWNKLFKRSLFANTRLQKDLKHNEDLLLNVMLFKKSNLSVFVDEPKYHYRSRIGSATRSSFNLLVLDNLMEVSKRTITILEDETDLLLLAIKRRLCNMIVVYKTLISHKINTKAKKNYRKKIKNNILEYKKYFYLLPNKQRLSIFAILHCSFLLDIVYLIYAKLKNYV